MIGLLATAGTFLKAFPGPVTILLLVGLVGGTLGGGWLGHKLTESRALRAEQALSDYRLETAKAIAAAAERQIVIRDEVRETHETAQQVIRELAGTVRDLRRDVRVCAATSRMPVPGPAPGTGQAAGDGQPRPADQVLQELAAFLAERADRQAAGHAALVEWLDKTRQAETLAE